MTTSRKSTDDIDRLVELHINLSARVGAALGFNPKGYASFGYSNDPRLPRVQIPNTWGDGNRQLLALSALVLQVYDRSSLPPDLGMLTLRVAVGDAMGEAITESFFEKR